MHYTNFALLVKKSRVKGAGLGLFTCEMIHADDVVGLLKVKPVLRGDKYSFSEIRGVCFTMDCNFRYMNHSTRPNCRLQYDEELEKVLVCANRMITPGTELKIDYWPGKHQTWEKACG